MRPARDQGLLDALEALPGAPFQGHVWRVVREGRDPTQCSASGGRWDDRSFFVLYASTHAEGARAEMRFHLMRGQPVMPSRVRYRLYELRVACRSCLRIGSVEALAQLGVKVGGFGQLNYAEREPEYPRTQEVAEAAYFLGRDGMLVPSARSAHANLVVFFRDRSGIARTKNQGNWLARPSHRPAASQKTLTLHLLSSEDIGSTV